MATITFNAHAILDAVAAAEQAILDDIKAAAVAGAKASAPVVSGAYRDGLQATEDGVYGAADHSIFVELRHGTIANAVAAVDVDSIAAKHKV